jgi:lipopolysaccharide transport system ATP-binding protein
MEEIAIKVVNLSKKYKIGERVPYKTLREEIIKFFKRDRKKENEYIWALKDVSLEIKKGEIVGIIGPNGAGKTTLLKILSRITEPTDGYAEVYGRVGSLLEVGVGFHPELTGRENIYLNGAMLGMSKKEIDKKFDQIVSFAEIEKFIDTPVKHYSSGMYVRLAFSVAAHLEPEILLVDEVLAVGDISFQQKCLGKMDQVTKEGRTVLFVSHNMSAIRSLCKRVIWLENGKIKKEGDANSVTIEYEETFLKYGGGLSPERVRKNEEIKNKEFYFKKVGIFDEKGNQKIAFKYDEKIVLNIELEGKIEEKFHIVFRIYDKFGTMVFAGASAEFFNKYFTPDVRKIKIEIGPTNLTKGTYRIELLLRKGKIQKFERDEIDIWDNACFFEIIECSPFETNWQMESGRDGIFLIPSKFEEL